MARPKRRCYALTMPPIHRLHLDTRYDPNDETWSVFVFLNDAPCGALGPVLDERTADWLADGLREGMSLAMQKAMAAR